MVFTYGRSASGTGQAARPFLRTMRLGLNLKRTVYTGPTGGELFGNIRVTGNTGPYQLDAANGRVYFTRADEDRVVTVEFTGVDPATGGPVQVRQFETGAVTWVSERSEEPILMDRPVNEANVASFLDPFDLNDARRPGLVWLFWASTRGGVPDLFFQTIAPRLAPVVKGR
jgi:hypothetical protein